MVCILRLLQFVIHNTMGRQIIEVDKLAPVEKPAVLRGHGCLHRRRSISPPPDRMPLGSGRDPIDVHETYSCIKDQLGAAKKRRAFSIGCSNAHETLNLGD